MTANQIRLLPLLFMMVAPNSAQAQWTNWPVSAGGNDHWYHPVRVTKPISWSSAYKEAQSFGGYLVTITSPEENTFVFNLIDNPLYWNGELGPLLGAYQPTHLQEPAGGWTW